MAGYIGTQAVSVNTTSATISDDLTVGDDVLLTSDAAVLKIGADADLQLTHSGSVGTITNGTGNLTLDVAGDIILDADGGDLKFHDGGTHIGSIYNDSTNLAIYSKVNNADMKFIGVGGGSDVTALELDMSDTGAAIFSGTLMMPDRIKHTGDTDTYFQFSAANTISLVAGDVETFKTTGTEVTINESGGDVDFRVEGDTDQHALFVEGATDRVSIGSNDPPMKLTVRNGTANSDVAKFTGAGTGAGLTISTASTTRDDDTVILKASDAFGEIAFVSDSTEVMRITDANVVNFHGIAGRATGSTGHASFSEQDNNRSYLELATTTTDSRELIAFLNSNNKVGTISVSGTATAYNESSDYRLKENVVYDWDATTRLKQLKPARFNFIADADTTVDGFLAHEAQAAVPQAVTGTKDAVDDEGNPVIQQIDKSKLVPLLVKTILELEARITALEG